MNPSSIITNPIKTTEKIYKTFQTIKQFSDIPQIKINIEIIPQKHPKDSMKGSKGCTDDTQNQRGKIKKLMKLRFLFIV